MSGRTGAATVAGANTASLVGRLCLAALTPGADQLGADRLAAPAPGVDRLAERVPGVDRLAALAPGVDRLAALDDHLEVGPCAVPEAGRAMHEAVLAVATARDYLESVARWLVGRRSFGAQLTSSPVLRQRLAWATVALACADAVLAAAGDDEGGDPTAAVSAARDCVSACERVHGAAGILDARPGVVHALFVRGLRRMSNSAGPLTAASPAQVYGQLTARLRVPLDGAAAQARHLVAELERICPVATATLPEELAVAEAMAQYFAPGLVGRVLAHRNVTATYLAAGSDAAPLAADLLPAAAAGSVLTALAVTEPHTGSDLNGLTSVIRRHGTGRVLDGVKTCVTGGADTDALLVAARTDDVGTVLVWVDPSRPGVTRLPLSTRAWHDGGLARVDIRSYDVPERAVHPGDGVSALLRGLGRERLLIAGQQFGYARRWLAELPVHQPGLVDRARACRALLRRVMAVSGTPSLVECSMVKLACCELAADVADARLTLLATMDSGADAGALLDDQAGARAATVAAGTADLNLAIVEGKVTAMFGAAGGGQA